MSDTAQSDRRKCTGCNYCEECCAERRRLAELHRDCGDAGGRPQIAGQDERIERYAALIAAGKGIFE